MLDQDDDLYALVRTEFQPVRLTDSLNDVTTRGRRLRTRRRAGAGLTAALVAGGLTLTLSAGPEPAAPMRPVASSVQAEGDGTVVLTVRQLTDADRLTAELRAAGVSARVELKLIDPDQQAIGCAENGQPSLPQLLQVLPMAPGGAEGEERVFVIRRDRMPPGTSLHFVIFDEPGHDGSRHRSVHTSLVKGYPRPCVDVD